MVDSFCIACNSPSLGFSYIENFQQNKEPVFVHVPKTGGTSILVLFDVPEDGSIVKHHPIPGEKYFTVVRDPVDRFISSFNMWMAEHPKYRKKASKLDIWNGHPGSPGYPAEFKAAESFEWDNVNDFAEKLVPGSREETFVKNPKNDITEHIMKGAKWKMEAIPKDQWAYIGKNEEWDKTIKDISNLLDRKPNQRRAQRINKIVTDTHLSSKGRANLRKFLQPEYDYLKSMGIHYK